MVKMSEQSKDLTRRRKAAENLEMAYWVMFALACLGTLAAST
jgi:hypothetical protein